MSTYRHIYSFLHFIHFHILHISIHLCNSGVQAIKSGQIYSCHA
jgi:hypothetical protein